MSNHDDKIETRRAYQQALKRPTNAADNPNTWRSWADKWDTAMAKAIKTGLGEMADVSLWSTEFFRAVEVIAPQWAITFQTLKAKEIANGSLTYREVGNRFRQVLASIQPPKMGRALKGAFGATFDGSDEITTHDHGDASGDAQVAEAREKLNRRGGGKKTAGRGRGGKRSFDEHEDSGRSSGSCPACHLYHS